MCGTSLHFGTGIDQQEGIGGHVGSHNFDSGVSFSISREIHTPTTTTPGRGPTMPIGPLGHGSLVYGPIPRRSGRGGARISVIHI